jgi:hypothetical protein
MMRLVYALALLLGLAVPAEATTFYASTTGSGSACSQASPCTLTTLIATLAAGDIGIVTAGTYSGVVAINNKSGTESQPITLRAENLAVQCADPTNDPDGCVVNTANRSILSNGMRISSSNADHWIIEGFETRDEVQCIGSGVGVGPDNLTIRYMHFNADTSNDEGTSITYCSDVVIEHLYATRLTTADTGRYAITLFFSNQDVTVRNIFCTGSFHHCISVKRFNVGVTIERFVCFGVASECIHVGQEPDDTASVSGGSTSCPGATLGSGGTGTVWDMTSRNVTVRRMYAVPGDQGSDHYVLRIGFRVGNVQNLDAQDIFAANEDSNGHPFWHTRGNTGPNIGVCGEIPGNNSIRGIILVNAVGPCAVIDGTGQSSTTLTIENYICHSATQQAFTFSSLSGVNIAGYPSTAHPITTIRNSVFNDCSTAFSGQVGARFTQSHNDVFNCGTSPGGTGAQTVDPQFVGPETVPDGTIDLTNGEALWDWAGRYQPIINRFDTQQGSLVDAGTGTAEPCTGAACDIGANEFLFEMPGEEIWESCAVYGNGDQVFGPFTNPWIDGRTGLVVDVDCAQKRIVIGRCDDPLDEATCDTDIYIHKAAQLRNRRVNDPITLSAGTAGADADTNGTCWRTRAVFDFTESLEELTGIWVRYEIDPNGGTHTCASQPESVEWAWQGAE